MSELTFNERFTEVWKHTQRGLVYPAPFAIFSNFWLKNPITRSELAMLMQEVRRKINTDPRLGSKNTTLVVGVSFENWALICEQEKMPLPKGMRLRYPQDDHPLRSKVFDASNGNFKDSEANLWFHIKSDDVQACDIVLELTKNWLRENTRDSLHQSAASKSGGSDKPHGGRVLGCRFAENLNNPSDPISLAKHSIVGVDDVEHFGASFVLSQRFLINWDQINMMSEDQIEDLIGRKTDDTIIPDRDTRSHIKASRVQDEFGNTTPVLRLGLPFGNAQTGETFRNPKSVTAADEEGIYFAGFAKEIGILEDVMQNQIGAVHGFMNDRLFNHLRSDRGGFFYVPSLQDIGLLDDNAYANNFDALNRGTWDKFPGVDWSRLDRHFTVASENGLMYYNHSNYLFNMATKLNKRSDYFEAPSNRILSLLENAFSLWQDNWYFNRKQEEIEHDIAYYMAQFDLPGKPADVMRESIMLRKGWAIRLSLHLFTSPEYGFRGRRIHLSDGRLIPYSAAKEAEGTVVYGSDTFRISPEEIIVGAMPNLTLGEGRYVMKYLSEAERLNGFLANLSEASGVGHVIPDYQKALDLGLGGLLNEVAQYERKAATQQQRELYQSTALALQGISEYFMNYAGLAKQMAQDMQPGQAWEQQNLTAIERRMRKLATEKPGSFVEAVQFIFTLHTCLHLNGEPTAFGRMDQLLQPYLDRDAITLEEAQEIIDAFYIKLDEKIQQNRIFMEDHQPFGNLAMGGSSGPYPQGASLGQWIQQITVGGTVADGETDMAKTKPAYNDVTRLFIRASGRLPLNAPCLSLRTRKDIPDEILEEAAHAMLSGGAHPILLNDETLIEGLWRSGDDVGGEPLQGNKAWRSDVEMKSAQNYACDGCYEPQFPGENWFSLGGFSTLQPLECALNQGRTYSSAGQSYLFGQTVSLTTRPAEQIESFDALLALYRQHFEWINRKAFNGQLMSYGNNTQYCPSPILNALMDDCLAKGLDFYSGGAKYNIYGPCYIALSSTINSLYAIKCLVFDDETAVTTLPELLECLCCDWGYKMTEPFISKLAGESRIAARADRFKRLREVALSLPRYGRGHAEIDAFGNTIVELVAQISIETFTQPWPQLRDTLQSFASKYGTADHPFGIQIQPGVGTFENHVEMGAWNGASADGRRMGTTVASDMSAAPSPADLPVEHQYAGFAEALAGFEGSGSSLMTDGAPSDFNIAEDFPAEKLKQVLRQFVQGKGSNILTVTVANPDTFADAIGSPEKYDLLRVRTGGWTNFFTSVFPVIQEQHWRRPVSLPEQVKADPGRQCPFHAGR
ncbi:Dyp-type peroxidase [Burkholderia anthina]|uniref:Dyp-type peroxidase n=1 Tax=Burkholderia anthina TaxID=179879 RepID=UPI0015889162